MRFFNSSNSPRSRANSASACCARSARVGRITPAGGKWCQFIFSSSQMRAGFRIFPCASSIRPVRRAAGSTRAGAKGASVNWRSNTQPIPAKCNQLFRPPRGGLMARIMRHCSRMRSAQRRAAVACRPEASLPG